MKILLIGFCFLFFTRAGAFTVISQQESRFVNPEVAIDITSGGDCTSLGMTTDEVFNLVMEAVDKYWNRVPHCGLNLVRGRVVNVPVDGINVQDSNQLRAVVDEVTNNRIMIACNEGSFDSPSILAAGTIANNRGVVFVNAASDSIFSTVTPNQRLAVLAHEIGHAFGLGHSADPVALMYYSISGKVQEKLNTDDFDGCAYLYPNDFPGNCSMIPYIKNGSSDSPPGGERAWQIFWPGLILGLSLIALLSGGASRLWRN